MRPTATSVQLILFNSEMVRAILDGRKTHTRRIVKPQPKIVFDSKVVFRPMGDSKGRLWGATAYDADQIRTYTALCPYGKPGDRLWVREAYWDKGYLTTDNKGKKHWVRWRPEEKIDFYYSADGAPKGIRGSYTPFGSPIHLRQHPSIHMPKWACRLWLEVKSVRIERVQEISWRNCKAEGIILPKEELIFNNRDQQHSRLITRFQELWDSINTKRGYDYDEHWIPAKSLKAGYYDIILEPGDTPRRLRYWPPFKDKQTGEYVGACVGEDPESLTLDIVEPSKIKFIVGGEQVGMRKKKVRVKANGQRGYDWESNPWVWVIEFERIVV